MTVLALGARGDLNLRLGRIASGLAVALLAYGFTAARVIAAAPPIVIVSGALLSQPAVLADWRENVVLLGSGADNPIAQVDLPQDRPYLDLFIQHRPRKPLCSSCQKSSGEVD